MVKGLTRIGKLCYHIRVSRPDFAQLLEQYFLDWQIDRGERCTLKEFAEYLDMNPAQISQWINGRRIPSKENIDKLAIILGPEVYDALDLPRPDPTLVYINEKWDQVPAEIQHHVKEIIEKYLSKGESFEEITTENTDQLHT